MLDRRRLAASLLLGLAVIAGGLTIGSMFHAGLFWEGMVFCGCFGWVVSDLGRIILEDRR